MGESEKQLENDEERNMATIKDIAARAGVTATTVSRVINNRGYISEETRKKVTQAMQEMNYQPNELARSLAKAAFQYDRGYRSAHLASRFSVK